MAMVFTQAQISSLATAFALNLSYTTVDHNGYVLHVTTPINIPTDATTARTNTKSVVGTTLGIDPTTIFLYEQVDIAKMHFLMGTSDWNFDLLEDYQWN